MSVSLNDHENRIKVLENKSTSSNYSETLLWSGSNLTGSVTLSQPISNFNMLCIHAWNEHPYQQLISVTESKVLTSSSQYTLLHFPMCKDVYIKTTDWKTISVAHSNTTVKRIVGIKWGGGINLGTLLQRLLVYIKKYSKLFHLQFLEVK